MAEEKKLCKVSAATAVNSLTGEKSAVHLTVEPVEPSMESMCVFTSEHTIPTLKERLECTKFVAADAALLNKSYDSGGKLRASMTNCFRSTAANSEKSCYVTSEWMAENGCCIIESSIKSTPKTHSHKHYTEKETEVRRCANRCCCIRCWWCQQQQQHSLM